MDDSSLLRTPDRLVKLSRTHAQPSEVFETMIGACMPYNLGGSTIASIRATIARAIVVLLYKTSKHFGSNEFIC
jgi:hypothetical protein